MLINQRVATKFMALNVAKILVLIAILIFIVSVYSSTYTNSNATAGELADAVLTSSESGTVENTEQATDLDFKKMFGLNAADYDGVVYYRPASNMDADEMLIVKASSQDQTDAIKDAVDSRIDDQKNVFDGYAPEQYSLLCDAKVTVKGKFVFYIVSSDAEEYRASFLKALKRSQ